jgi:hypothetical protein
VQPVEAAIHAGRSILLVRWRADSIGNGASAGYALFSHAHVDVKQCIVRAMILFLLMMTCCLHQFYIKIRMG